MRIDSEKRRIRLSVGELARFRSQSLTGAGGHRPWRAEVGRQWHQAAEAQAREFFPEARFEVPLQVEWLHGGWLFETQGRMDQVLPQKDSILIRELKTVRTELPEPEETLMERYPEYFNQVATYLCLARKLPEWQKTRIDAEIQFIAIDSGTVQSVGLGRTAEDRFTHQLNQLVHYMERRRACRLRFRTEHIRPAFSVLRDGQAAAIEALASASLQSQYTLFEAPTGFGKTGIALQHILKRMQEGHFDRCIYLTGKSTGQLETVRQLRAMTGSSLRYLQMRNRQEHAIDSARHRCTGDRRCEAMTPVSGETQPAIDVDALFESGTFPLERAKALGEETGLCPYALTRACLPYADFWIADYNYIFSPDSRHLFNECPGFDPGRTCLLIDEAHNLPSRSADALSLELSSAELDFAVAALRETGAPRRLLNQYEALSDGILDCPVGGALETNRFYALLDLLEEISRQLERTPLRDEALLPATLDFVWAPPRLLRILNDQPDDWLFWTPEKGRFAATCLRSTSWIRRCLEPFASVHMMSATLEPVASFSEECGLDENQRQAVHGQAVWRETAYDVAIDTRVDTRFKSRARHYEETAATIRSAIESSPGQPVVVFFPSYLYAENVDQYLGALDPMARSEIQPRGGNLQARAAFIEEGLRQADALFLVLGSSYAEGIDQLGGRVDVAIVVGPALPEMNLVQKTKLEQHPCARREGAFEAVCIEPAMRRIHQALGRLIRAPGQRTKVLLHGKRFDEDRYFEKLRPEYQSTKRIQNRAELNHWLFDS